MKGERRASHGTGRQAKAIELPKEVHITPRMYQKLTEKIAGKPEERIGDEVPHRETEYHDASGTSDSPELRERGVELGQVLEHAQADDSVKRLVGKRHRQDVARTKLGVDTEPLQRVLDARRLAVDLESHDPVRATRQLGNEDPRSVADVEDGLERTRPE